jgi:hypothetical protein
MVRLRNTCFCGIDRDPVISISGADVGTDYTYQYRSEVGCILRWCSSITAVTFLRHAVCEAIWHSP